MRSPRPTEVGPHCQAAAPSGAHWSATPPRATLMSDSRQESGHFLRPVRWCGLSLWGAAAVSVALLPLRPYLLLKKGEGGHACAAT